jgi:hypothetical protein
MNILGLEAFAAFDDFELDLFTFVQGFEALSDYCGMVDEDILTRLLDNESEPFFIIEPFDLATGHINLLGCLGG